MLTNLDRRGCTVAEEPAGYGEADIDADSDADSDPAVRPAQGAWRRGPRTTGGAVAMNIVSVRSRP